MFYKYIIFCIIVGLGSSFSLQAKEMGLLRWNSNSDDNLPAIQQPTPHKYKEIKRSSNIYLTKIKETPNEIIDDDSWWEKNQLSKPYFDSIDTIPEFIPREIQGVKINKVIKSDPLIAIYNQDKKSYVMAIDSISKKRLFVYDLSDFTQPHDYIKEDESFILMSTKWAVLDSDILYVSNAHGTYASSSKGFNAQITAIDIKRGTILWRSKPLVANAFNFVVKDNIIISGYGFTDEPDYLYILDKSTGSTLKKISIKTGPDYLIEKDGKLFVRTYNTDYIFK